MCAFPLFSSQDIIKVGSIEFRGLHYLTKKEIVSGSRIKSLNDGILVDLNSVREVLGKSSIVKKYDVFQDRNRLIISVLEKKPLMVIALVDEKRTDVFEIDMQLRVISKKRLFSGKKPVIFFDKKFFPKGNIMTEIKNISYLFNRLKQNNMSIYDEISEIYYKGNEKISLFLSGRKTEFILKSEEKNFFRLQYITGYLDWIRYYPVMLNINENMLLIR